MHQQLWGYKVEWKSVSRGTGGKKVEYHCSRASRNLDFRRNIDFIYFFAIIVLLLYYIRKYELIKRLKCMCNI
jgi:hypothetical protein